MDRAAREIRPAHRNEDHQFQHGEGRYCAWVEAGNLVTTPQESLDGAIAALDLRVAVLGRLVVSPPLLVKLQLLPVRTRENNDVRRVLEILAGRETAAATSASA